MKERYRLLYLIVIMIFSVSLVGGFTFYELYKTSVDEQRKWLANTARSQARLLESIARYDSKDGVEVHPGGIETSTLEQFVDAYQKYKGFGETGEFALAKRESDKIVFLLRHRHHDLDNPEPVPFHSDLAEPMERALSGQSGTMIGRDYRGVNVLAAYEPVDVLGFGIVAKMDIVEIRRPFIFSAIKAGAIAVILIVIGATLFIRLTNPIIRNLQESEERFRSTFQQAAVGIAHVAPNGQLLKINKHFCDITGYTEEELLKLKYQSITHPDDIEADTTFVNQMLDGEINTYTMEKRYIKKDDTFVWVNLTVSLVVDNSGGPRYFISVIENITEQKKAVDRISSLASILEESLNEIYIFDSKTLKFVQVNKGARGNLGYSMDELKDLTPVDIKPESTQESFEKQIGPLRTGEKESIQFSTVHQRKDGSLYNVEVHLQLSLFESSHVFVAIILDITERKKAADALHKAYNELENRVEERTKELAMAITKLEEKNKEHERYNKVFVEREFRIKELRDRIKELEEKIDD